MRILIVGESGRAARARGRARGRGNGRRARSEGELSVPGGDEVGELAGALLAFDRLFSDDPPDGVLLLSASNLALSAVLVATKLQIPVATLAEGSPGARAGMNGRLSSSSRTARSPMTLPRSPTSLRDLIAACATFG